MKRPSELLKYHPNRYYQTRRFFGRLYNYFRSAESQGGVLSVDAFQDLTGRFLSDHWRPELVRMPLELRPFGIGRASQEVSLFCHVASFTKHGRNIFDISPSLAALLKLTDVDDVRWDCIRMPYDYLYISFGPQHGWHLTDAQYCIDGAYVSKLMDQVVQVLLTTYRPGLDYSQPLNFIATRDVYFYFSFDIAGDNSTVGDSFRNTIKIDDAFNESWEPPPIDPDTMRLAEAHGVTLRQDPEKCSQRITAHENRQNLPVFRDVLNLIVNCLCYLSSSNREVTTEFPAVLERQLDQSRDAVRLRRVREKWLRQGYTQIHFCGRSLDRDAESQPTGRELSAHWRRGHWRNQAIGPALAEHKLIWIRPTLVRKDKAGDDLPGHVYTTEQ